MRNTAKTLMVAAASVPLAMASLSPAHAGKPVTYDYSSVNATLIHAGAMDGFEGNAHIVDIWGDADGYAEAYVVSFDCADGAVPSWEYESDCSYLDDTWMDGSDVAVTVDDGLTAGSIVGTLTSYTYDWETDEVTEGPSYDVDLSVTGTGEVFSGSEKYKGSRFSYSYRSGSVEGSFGAFDLAGADGMLMFSSERYKDSSKYQERFSGESVSLSWTEIGELPGGVAGNAHVGDLWIDSEDGWADGKVIDWTCPEGELPPTWGGHDDPHFDEGFEEEPETNCVQESVRFIWADGTLDVSMDKKLSSATITGTLNVEDHDTGAGGSPAVDITITGDGELTTYSYKNKWSDEWGTGKDSYTSSSRSGTVDGYIGAMGFADDEDDISSAEMSAYKGMYRESW